MKKIKERADYAAKILDKMKMPNNPAVVFDIDGTLIDSGGKVIAPIFRLYNYVKILCITPIIITNRLDEPNIVGFTKYQLMNSGITDFDRIYFRKATEMDFTRAKINARKKVIDDGFNIIMSIGDQKWDMGDYGGVGILLPSEF